MSRIHSSPDTTLTFESLVFPQPVFVKSPFQAHHLRPGDFTVGQVHSAQPDWVLAILLLCFLLLAWTQVFYHKRVRQIIRAPFSQRFINQLTRDGNLFRERVSVSLGIVYLLAFTLFLFEFNSQILRLTIPPFEGFSLYLLITAITLAILIFKVFLIQLLGSIFRTREITNSYLLNILIFALLSGPMLLFMLVFIAYLNSVILFHICTIIFIITLIFRFLRGYYIGLALTKFSYLFLFVYLCSLEILPLLVLVKILINYLKTVGA
jgi:hypothetical protein